MYGLTRTVLNSAVGLATLALTVGLQAADTHKVKPALVLDPVAVTPVETRPVSGLPRDTGEGKGGQYESRKPGVQQRIPAHSKEWTNHSESDPGQTMMKQSGAVQEKPAAAVKAPYNSRQKMHQLREANEAAAPGREAARIEEMRTRQKEMQNIRRGAGEPTDPAAETALGGRGPGIQKQDLPTLRGIQSSDCVTSPADCVEQPDGRPGGFSDPTRSGADEAGAPGDPGTASSSVHVGSAAATSGDSASTKDTYLNSDGTTTVVQREISSDKILQTITTVDKEGNQVGVHVTLYGKDGSSEVQRSEGKVNTDYRDAENIAGQPTEGGNTGWSNQDACNYNPLTGRCQGGRRPSHEEMTGQPSPTDEESDTGSSSGPTIGTEAVTNTGGGDWSMETGGSGGSGSKAWDGLVDPEEGEPLHGPVPEPGD